MPSRPSRWRPYFTQVVGWGERAYRSFEIRPDPSGGYAFAETDRLAALHNLRTVSGLAVLSGVPKAAAELLGRLVRVLEVHASIDSETVHTSEGRAVQRLRKLSAKVDAARRALDGVDEQLTSIEDKNPDFALELDCVYFRTKIAQARAALGAVPVRIGTVDEIPEAWRPPKLPEQPDLTKARIAAMVCEFFISVGCSKTEADLRTDAIGQKFWRWKRRPNAVRAKFEASTTARRGADATRKNRTRFTKGRR